MENPIARKIENLISRLEDGEKMSVDEETLARLQAADPRVKTTSDPFFRCGVRAYIPPLRRTEINH